MAMRSASRMLSNIGLSYAPNVAFKAIVSSRMFASVEPGYHYAKSHEWTKVDGDVATVGISDHAQAELGDIVYVELPEVGRVMKAGETFGVVESVKAASDVYSPISGEVTEVNSALVDKPATINGDPYKGGWIMKVKLSDKAEVNKLMDAAAYKTETDH